MGARNSYEKMGGGDELQARLWAACARGDDGAVSELLASGADPNLADAHGLAPVHHAALEGHLSVLEALLRGGADLSVPSALDASTPLILSAATGSHPCVSLLLSVAPEAIDARNASRMTALHLACLVGSVNIVRTLLNNGADHNVQDIKGRIPLELIPANSTLQGLFESLVQNVKENI
jgi:ankyrin repeat protein